MEVENSAMLGFGVMIPLILTENSRHLWMPWTFTQIIFQPLQGYYYSVRMKQLKAALLEWNRY